MIYKYKIPDGCLTFRNNDKCGRQILGKLACDIDADCSAHDDDCFLLSGLADLYGAFLIQGTSSIDEILTPDPSKCCFCETVMHK